MKSFILDGDTCMWIHIYACTHKYMCVFDQTYVNVHVYVDVYIYIQCVYMCILASMLMLPFFLFYQL